MYARNAMAIEPTPAPIATPVMAPFASPALGRGAVVDDGVVLVVGTDVDEGAEAGTGSVVAVDQAIDGTAVV